MSSSAASKVTFLSVRPFYEFMIRPDIHLLNLSDQAQIILINAHILHR